MSNIGQEIMLVDISIQQNEVPDTQLALNDDLARINAELDRYTCHAQREEYALAVASGILAGVVDALYVGDTPLLSADTNEAHASVHKWVNNFIEDYAAKKGFVNKGPRSERLRNAIDYLEKTFPVAQDNTWSGQNIRVYTGNHHLADLAHHPTPAGLVAAIVVQFFRVGIFVNRDGEWHLLPVETTEEDVLNSIIPAVITGFLNWLVAISTTTYEELTEQEAPEAIKKLAHLMASTPMLIEVAKCADNWFGHLISDVGGSKATAGHGMGVPGIILSMLYETAALPPLNTTGLLEYLNNIYTKDRTDLRQELINLESSKSQMLESLGKQTIPVILNEVLVRTGFFVLQLARAFSENQPIADINWGNIIPVGNRTVDRMMTVSTMTLTLADTADAAVRASVESAGNWIIFSQRFAARFNFVASGRAAIAIVREASDDAKELQLLHEKRLLTEAKTAFTIEQLEAYKAQLQDRLDAYLQEDLEAFLMGFSIMDQGLQQGDSNLVIAGNVVIQKALGREAQFTSQDEFDALMESDDDFVF